MKMKSSDVLRQALNSLLLGTQQYACAAIQDAETTKRFEVGEEITSNAAGVLSKFMPSDQDKRIKLYGQWWPKGSPLRIEAVEKALKMAISRGD